MKDCNRLNLYMFMLDTFTQRERDCFDMGDVKKSIVSNFGDILESAYCKHIVNVFHTWCKHEGVVVR